MTPELIVALDGTWPLQRACSLYDEAGVRWFKLGPQTMHLGALEDLIRQVDDGKRIDLKIFLDLKLADTADTCREALRRYCATNAIAAVSTYTDAATAAAVEGVEAGGGDVQVWRLTRLTDGLVRKLDLSQLGHGVICPVEDIQRYSHYGLPIISPGIRSAGTARHGHKASATPRDASLAGATYVVVGRPIYNAADPVAAAKIILDEMRIST